MKKDRRLWAGGPLQDCSVAIVAAATAANIKLCTHRAGTRAPGIRAANLVPALIVPGIGIVWSFVLAVSIRIELRSFR